MITDTDTIKLSFCLTGQFFLNSSTLGYSNTPYKAGPQSKLLQIVVAEILRGRMPFLDP